MNTVSLLKRPAGAHRSHRALELVCDLHRGCPPAHPVDDPHRDGRPRKAKAGEAICGGNGVARCDECGSTDLRLPCNVGGVAIATWRKILAMPTPDDGFGDHWSCVMRPGAWEYERPEAEAMRRALAAAGYVEETDLPNRPLGTRWRHRNQRPGAA